MNDILIINKIKDLPIIVLRILEQKCRNIRNSYFKPMELFNKD